jgi:hypothetical protein
MVNTKSEKGTEKRRRIPTGVKRAYMDTAGIPWCPRCLHPIRERSEVKKRRMG